MLYWFSRGTTPRSKWRFNISSCGPILGNLNYYYRRLWHEPLEERRLLAAIAAQWPAQYAALNQATAAGPNELMQPQIELIGSSSLEFPQFSGPFTPTETRHAYGIDQLSFPGTPAADGTGTTIAIVDAFDQPNLVSDLHQFDQNYGLADPVLTQVNESGGTTLPAGDTTWGEETSLDVEWAHAIAPGAHILLVEANTNDDSDLMSAVDYARNAAGVVVVSMSFAGPEYAGENLDDTHFLTPAGHGGVAFVAGSGDKGTPASYPSASPDVLSVGGTSLTTDPSGNYTSESAWSGSGGGISSDELPPSYQAGVVPQNPTGRATPDVAYNADPSTGFLIYDTYNFGGWQQVGGTSDAAPQWAALVSIVDQGRVAVGETPLDGSTQLLPAIYALPQSTDFNDITTGSSVSGTSGPSEAAAPGYDLATGLGSPKANVLVPALINASVPVVYVTAGGNSVNNGATAPALSNDTYFGNNVVVGKPQSETFTIGNHGTQPLTVGTVSIGGTNAGDFSVITQPTGSIGPGGTTTFVVRFSPSALGLHMAQVSFTDGDPNSANPYTFTVGGTGVATPTTINLSSSATQVAYGQSVNLTASVQTVPSGTSISNGSVSFFADGNLLATVPISGGGAALNNVALGPGTHSLSAQYSGFSGAGLLSASDSGATANSIINTVAGSNNYVGDGLTATAAQFYFGADSYGFGTDLLDEGGVATDAAGNLYVADSAHHVIRMINATTHIVTTIAGTGVAGYSGDGGPATAATLNLPGMLAVDAAGDVYFPDELANVVREIHSGTGIITTVAGTGAVGYSGDNGLATSAKLDYPQAVALDPNHNYLYVADTSNSVVRRVDLSSGVITTIAGVAQQTSNLGDGGLATAANLWGPYGLVVDNSGNLYIADQAHNRVREVNFATGIITTVAGNGTADYPTPGAQASATPVGNPAGLALGSSGNLYIIDSYVSRVLVVNHSTGVLSVIAGTNVNKVSFGFSGDGGPATSAQLNVPYGIALDAVGNVYVEDTSNARIREINTSGVISTYAGNGIANYGGNGGPATSAELHIPLVGAVDAAGDLFISDQDNSVVREVNHATGVISVVAGNGTPGYTGNGGLATNAEIDGVLALAVDAAGDLFLVDQPNSVVREVNHATGIISVVAGNGVYGYSGDGGPATSAKLSDVGDIAMNTAGTLLYIADATRIRTVNLTTGTISTIAGNGVYGNTGDYGLATSASITASGLALDGIGDLFFADANNDVVRDINLNSGIITRVAGNGQLSGGFGNGLPATSVALLYPKNLATDSVGDLFISQGTNVREVSRATGIMTTLVGSDFQLGFSGDGGAAGSSLESNIAGLNLDSSGNLIVADAGNNRVREVYGSLQLTVAGPLVAVTGNKQAIADGATATSTVNATNFGTIASVGGSVVETYTIDNTGTQPLSVGSVQLSGTNAGDFLVTSQPASTVAPGTSTTFSIRFSPTAAGARSAIVSFTDNDTSQANPFTFAISGVVTTAQIAVTGLGQAIADGAASTNSANATDFGSVVIGANVTETYTISNPGGAPLTVGTGSIMGASAGDFTVTVQPAGSVAAGSFTTFSVRFQPTVTGNRTASVSFSESDPTQANPFTFAIGGVGAVAQIAVAGLGQPISDGATSIGALNATDFGSANVGGTTVSETYTISNSGTGPLLIGAVTIAGANPSDFAVITAPAPAVAPGGSTNLVVRFQPKAPGNRAATINFTENDPSQASPFSFALGGFGVGPTIAVTGAGQAIADGATTTSTTNNTAFGSMAIAGTPISETYTIANNGNTTLNLGSVTLSGANAADFSITSQPASTVAAGTSTSFTVQFIALGGGTRSANVGFTQSDTTQTSPFKFAITGLGAAPQIAVSGNGQPINQNSFSPSSTNLTDFGAVALNSGTATETYTITNQGALALNLGSVSVTAGSHFSVISQPAATVAPGGSTTFVIGYLPAASGLLSALVTFTENDPSLGSTFTFEIQATGTAPSMNVLGKGVSISNGSTFSSTINGTMFTPASPGAASQQSYTISNQGSGNLTLGTVTVSGTTGDFSVITQPATTVAPGGSTSFTVQFLPASMLSQTATVFIPDNDPGFSSFSFQIGGQGISPAISVTGGASQGAILDGAATSQPANGTNLGLIPLGSSPLSETFRIANSGPSGSLLSVGTVTISGPNAADFSVVSQPAATVAGGGSTTFTIQFQPGLPGSRVAQVIFSENDPTAASPFNFAISAMAAQVPTSVTLAASNLTPAPGQSLSLTATVASLSSSVPSPSEGTVTFWDGATNLGFASVVSGTAVLNGASWTSLGSHTITATYDDGQNLYAAGTTVAAAANTITTVAGNGQYAGDGGPATAAEVAAPGGVVVDAAGNVYIADTQHNVVREVLAASGTITTIAGTGTPGFSGDGGPATASQLNKPSGLAFDALGRLLIADAGNNRVRAVDLSTGLITTIAGGGGSAGSNLGDGGPATAALLGGPQGIAVDGAGNLYIADARDELIRKVDHTTGVITSIAGTANQFGYFGDGGLATQARLNNPSGVAVDSAGNVYIADSSNNVVRKVVAATGVIQTFAGNGSSIFGGSGSLATSTGLGEPTDLLFDAAGNLLVSAGPIGHVLLIDHQTNLVTNIAGGGGAPGIGDGGPASAATLGMPNAIGLDTLGNLYIADAFQNRVREVAAGTGTITTFAGNGNFSIAGDGGPAVNSELGQPASSVVDSAGNIFIADTQNSLIREVHRDTGLITTVAHVIIPQAMAIDAQGNLYVANPTQVFLVNPGTGALTVVAGSGLSGFAGDGGPATVAKFSSLSGIAFDAAGDMYVIDSSNAVVREVDHGTGIIHTVAGQGGKLGYSGDGGLATAAKLFLPGGIALDAAGNLYIADSGNYVVREVNQSTGIITTVAGSASGVSDSGDGGLPTAAALDWPAQLAFDSAGDLFIADSFGRTVREVNHATGAIYTIAGPGTGSLGDNGPASTATLLAPGGISFDAAGDLFVADAAASRVREVSSGAVVLVVSSPVIAVSGNGQPILDGANVTSAANATDFGSVAAGNSLSRTYSITNKGNSPLSLGTITIGGPGAGNYTVTNQPPSSVAPGAVATFTIKFQPSTPGTSLANVSFSETDPAQPNPFTFAISSTGLSPQISVTGLGQPIADATVTIIAANATDFGSTLVGNSVTVTYTVSNTGNAPLALGSVAISGGDAADFSVVQQPANSIAAGSNTSFSIQFAPLALGSHLTSLTFTENDPAQPSPFNFAIGGGGVATPIVTVSDAGGPYNGNPYPATALVNGAATLEGVAPMLTYYLGSSPTGISSATAPRSAGTYTVVANFPGSTDYAPASSTPVTFAIGQLTPTVTVSDAGGPHNGNPYPATALVNGAAMLEAVAPTLAYYVGSSATGTPSSAPPTSAGTYTVVANFPGSIDYAPASSAPVTFAIGRLTPTVTVSDAGGLYNGNPYPATALVNGAATLEGVAPTLAYYLGSSTTGTPSSTAPISAGTYTVVANFPGSTDYAPASSSPVTFAIGAVSFTVSIAAVTPDPRIAPVGSMTIVFSEPAIGFSLSNLQLARNGGANLLSSTQTLTTANGTTWTLNGLSGLTAAAGNYTLTILPTGIHDSVGQSPAGNDSSSFVVHAPNHNAVNPLDVNNDGIVSPIDALDVINYLNLPTDASTLNLDVNADGIVTPLDALAVINYLNAPVSPAQTAHALPTVALAVAAPQTTSGPVVEADFAIALALSSGQAQATGSKGALSATISGDQARSPSSSASAGAVDSILRDLAAQGSGHRHPAAAQTNAGANTAAFDAALAQPDLLDS